MDNRELWIQIIYGDIEKKKDTELHSVLDLQRWQLPGEPRKIPKTDFKCAIERKEQEIQSAIWKNAHALLGNG